MSPNLCQGAATKKTSLFDWINLSNGSEVTSYFNSQPITSSYTGDIGTYESGAFKFNEGYYGTYTSNEGTITINYDGPLLSNNYSAPSGSAIAISGDYNGKGIKFTTSNALKGDDYILSFYASSTNASIVYVKANNTIY